MKKTYVFREAWPYHFDPLFDWISALPICSSAKILLARLHNSNRTLERVKRGEAGPFTFPWELQEIARTFRRANSAVTKWRAELEACARATDCRATWDNGSTVSDARQLLARTSQRFESGQVDPDIARKVRQSLLSLHPLRTARKRQTGLQPWSGLTIAFRRNERGSGHAGNLDLCVDRRRFQGLSGLSQSFRPLCESVLANP